MASAKLLTDGAWTWFNSPAARYDSASSAAYLGWIDAAGSIWAGKYSPSYELLQYAKLHTALEVDDHVDPAILPLASGKILAAYSQHNGSSYCRTSSNAGDIRSWASEVTVSTGNSDSYALLAQTADTNATVWWFFRRGSSNPRPRYYRVSTDGGATWGTPVSLFSVSSQRPYQRVCQGSGDPNRIDHLYSDGQPNEASTNSVYHFYQVVDSSGSFYTLYKSDGTSIGAYNLDGTAHTGTPPSLPLGPSNVTKIYDGTTHHSWLWDLCWVGSTLTAGYAVYTTATATDDTHNYYRATLSGGAWTSDLICDGGTSIPNSIYPDAANAEVNYSGGFCFDPNTSDRVYVSRKYAANVSGTGDQRIEQWDKSAGTWSKTVDITGGSAGGSTGHINARPRRIENNPTTQILYWSGVYNSYTSYASDLWAYPAIPTFSVKTASPTWVSGNGPLGTSFYFLLGEGTGAPTELVSGTSATNVGTPTWGTGTYGAQLSGFTTSVAVQLDSIASSWSSSAGYPRCIWVAFANTDTTVGQYILCFGNSSSNNDLFALSLNAGSQPQVSAIFRDSANTSNNLSFSSSAATDGNPHVLSLVAYSSSDIRLYLDGVEVATATTTLGSFSFQNFTLGAIRRNGTQSNPFNGALIAAGGSLGSVPDQQALYRGLITGQFGGTRGEISTGGSVLFFLDPSLSGGFPAMGL